MGTSETRGWMKLNQASHTCAMHQHCSTAPLWCMAQRDKLVVAWQRRRHMAGHQQDQTTHRLVGAGGLALKARGAGDALDARVGAVPVPGVSINVLHTGQSQLAAAS